MVAQPGTTLETDHDHGARGRMAVPPSTMVVSDSVCRRRGGSLCGSQSVSFRLVIGSRGVRRAAHSRLSQSFSNEGEVAASSGVSLVPHHLESSRNGISTIQCSLTPMCSSSSLRSLYDSPLRSDLYAMERFILDSLGLEELMTSDGDDDENLSVGEESWGSQSTSSWGQLNRRQ